MLIRPMIAQPDSRPPMLTVRNETVAADREVSLQITLGLSLGRPSGEDSPFLMVVPMQIAGKPICRTSVIRHVDSKETIGHVRRLWKTGLFFVM